MRNFFEDVPQFDDEHLTGPSEFYTHVGRCIKRWADLEGYLFEICDWALNGERSLSAIVFFRTPSIDARLTLVSDLLKRTLVGQKRDPKFPQNPTNLEIWSKLEKRIRVRLEFRNMLAHQPVAVDYAALLALPNGTPNAYDLSRVIQQDWDDKKRRPSSIKPISIEAMADHLKAVTREAKNTGVMLRRLQSHSKPLARRAERPPA